MVIAIALSLGVHLAALLLVTTLPRLLPHEAPPKQEGTVELLMVEQKGAQPSAVVRPGDIKSVTAPAVETSPPGITDSKNESVMPPAKAAQPSPPPQDAGKAVPTPATHAESPPAAPRKEAGAQPVPPRSQEGPVFNLEGTESQSNAVVLGGRVLPASRDDRFRNRPPLYPLEAEVHGEHGTVTLVIHVSENGIASGVDVIDSSGYEILDQAAVAAVRKWRFHPALREGRSIPCDMPFRFIFEP